MHRQALTATGLLVALVAGATSTAQAQNATYRTNPDPTTPRILIPTFRSEDRNLGVQAANEIRDRVITDVNVKQLFALYAKDIKSTLEASGYRADSALAASDLKELAKLMRADEILEGTVHRTPTGVRIEPRLLLARDVSLAQPLPVVEARNADDASKQIVRSMQEARKQLTANRECENALRANDANKAIEAARRGIAAYPQATLARLCLASAVQQKMQAKQATPDELITASDDVLKIDPKSRIALGLKYAAQREKGDTEGAVQTLVAMLAADPGNQQLQQQVVEALATLAPEKAIPIIDELVANNPGDPSLVRTQWLVLLRANQFKRAIQAGEALAKLDTAASDSTWYVRMIAAAAADSQAAKAAEYASRAVARYPQSASFYALRAQTLRSAGQLPQALAAIQRAVQLDPKVENGYVTLVLLQAQLGQPDSAMASARAATAAGVDKTVLGNALLASVQPLIQKAQASKTRADWQAAYNLAKTIHEFAPTPNSGFFLGVSGFSVGLDALQNLNKTKSCAEARLVEETWNTASPAMQMGGRVDPNTAGQILNAINQYSANVQQAKKALCK